MPPELEWLANITNPKTRRAYKNRRRANFPPSPGCTDPAELRTVTRAHVIAWRKDLEARALSPLQHPPQALGSVLAVRLSVRAQRRRRQSGRRREAADANGNEGTTPALGRCPGAQAARGAPRGHAQGRARSGHPRHPALSRHPPRGAVPPAASRICRAARASCISASGASATRSGLCRCTRWRSGSSRNIWRSPATAADTAGPLFRPVTNNRTGKLDKPLDPASVYHNIVRNMAGRPASAPK